MTKHEIRKVFIHSIAKQYDAHNQVVPSWLHIGDIDFELEKPRKGVWVKTGQSFVYPNKFRNYCCSECMWELDKHIRIEPNFCPNCGADMREVEE